MLPTVRTVSRSSNPATGRPAPAPLPGTLDEAHGSGQDRLATQPAPQVLRETERTGISPSRVLVQAFQTDRFQVAGTFAFEADAKTPGSSPITCDKVS